MKKYFISLWSIPAVLLVGLILVSGIVTQHVSAATGSIYLTPTSATVLSGANLTFTLRINPGTAVSGVEATVTFDTAKLQYVSASTAGSAFAAQLQQTVTGGNVNVARGDFGGGVSGDSLIETITFKSLVGSGSTNVTLSAGNATDQANPGSYTNPSLSGAMISFSAPAPTPTPTPTPAPTPSPTPSPAPTPAPGTNTTPSSTPTSPTTQSTPAPTAPAPAGTSQPTAGGTAATVSDVQPNVQYTLASVSFNTTTPTTAAIKYGLDPKLSITTPSSESATAHTVTLDPALLIPGQTYYYAIVTTDTAGHTSQSQVQTFKTRGLSLKIAVFAADHTPLRNTTVTLRSKAYTVKTDSNGIASITDVTPGVHHLEYTSGKNVLSQIVRVEPTITTVGSKQSAAIQNFSVIYNVKPTKHVNFMVFGPLLLLIAVGGYFFIRRERNVLSTPVTESSAILTAVPTVAVPNSSNNPSSPRLNTPSSDTVSRIPYPSTPNPGDTVTPHTNERNQ